MLFTKLSVDDLMVEENKDNPEQTGKWVKDILKLLKTILKLFKDDRIRLIALGLLLLVLAPIFVAKESLSQVLFGIIVIIVAFIFNLEKVKKK